MRKNRREIRKGKRGKESEIRVRVRVRVRANAKQEIK